MRNDMYLKPIDVPLIRTNTMCGVTKWIAELKDKDLFWHMDDDARQVPAFSPPVSANLLEAQRLLALNICHNHRIDIWTLIPMITTLKAFCATRVYETGPTMEELALHHTHDCMTQALIYGTGTDNLCGISDDCFKSLTYLEWIPPADGFTDRFKQSFDTPNFMRYTGYWTNRKWGHAFAPDKLFEAETWLFGKYRKDHGF